MKESNLHGQALRRILCFQKLLEYEYSLLCVSQKEFIKDAQKVHKENHLSVVTLTRKMIALGKNMHNAQVITGEMNSERIKDLGAFFDFILEINNIGEVCDLLKESLKRQLEGDAA